jgi:hypothetical protein
MSPVAAGSQYFGFTPAKSDLPSNRHSRDRKKLASAFLDAAALFERSARDYLIFCSRTIDDKGVE